MLLSLSMLLSAVNPLILPFDHFSRGVGDVWGTDGAAPGTGESDLIDYLRQNMSNFYTTTFNETLS